MVRKLKHYALVTVFALGFVLWTAIMTPIVLSVVLWITVKYPPVTDNTPKAAHI